MALTKDVQAAPRTPLVDMMGKLDAAVSKVESIKANYKAKENELHQLKAELDTAIDDASTLRESVNSRLNEILPSTDLTSRIRTA